MATSAMTRYFHRVSSLSRRGAVAKPAKAISHVVGAAGFGGALGALDARLTPNPTTGSGLDMAVGPVNLGVDGLAGILALGAAPHLKSSALSPALCTAGVVGLASWAQRRVKGWMT